MKKPRREGRGSRAFRNASVGIDVSEISPAPLKMQMPPMPTAGGADV